MTTGERGRGSRPGNVLFITLDQLRGDCVGALGHPLVRTPNLDRLVREGVAFTNHTATTAPCGPSRASLYTGLYAMNHRSVLNGTPLDARLTNVALEARAAGYQPALFGYTDTAVDPRSVAADDPRLTSYEGVLPGFDAVLDFPFDTLPGWLPWLEARGYAVDHDRPHAVFEPADVPVPEGRGRRWRPTTYADEHSESAYLTDALLDWLRARPVDGEPWFAHASYLRPHPPFVVPAPWNDAYDPADVPPPRRAATRDEEGRQHPLAAVMVGLSGVAAPDDDLDQRQLQATYYGMVSAVDAQVGRVLDTLDELGMADDTLVVLTSDHGEQLGDHWLIEKLGWFDASYEVPLLVRDPRAHPRAAGRRVDACTEHVDVMPTILDWLGIDVPVSVDGRSLLCFLTESGEAPARWRDAHHWEWDFRDPASHVAEDVYGITMEECSITVWRDARWKYVHTTAESLPNLLFDLESDPEQLRNVIDDPAYAAAALACATRLLSWRARHLDRSLTGTIITTEGPVIRVDPRVG